MKKQNSVVLQPKGDRLDDAPLQKYLNDGYSVVATCAQHVSAGSYDVKGAILVIVEKEILE